MNISTNLHLRTHVKVHLGGEIADFPLKLLHIGNGRAPKNDGYISMIGNNVATVLYTID